METFGGAERVLGEVAQAFPDAAVVAILGRASVARRMGIDDRFDSLLPARDRLLRHYRLLTPVLPALVDRLRLPEADVLLSSSYAFAHRLRTVNHAPSVCICHSPLRFAWTMTGSYRGAWASNGALRPAFGAFAAAMRLSDRRASRRVDRYLTHSQYVARQLARFYGVRAEVIRPPVDTELFRPDPARVGDYYLFCGRLVEPYKRPGMVIEAFRRLGWPLVIVGDGPERERLMAAAPPNVEFAGAVRDEELVALMQGSAAAIFPSRDDLGLIPLEVMACGRPVLAFAEGGALETIRAGVTGEFFTEQTVAALEAAVRAFDPAGYDSEVIRRHAEGWEKQRFRARLREIVAEVGAPAPGR
jgi:glycosyltransferase involved in cell wall biosynthesis